MPDLNPPAVTIRLATTADIDDISALMTVAIDTLQDGFLTPEQIAVSHSFMGLDTQLIRDQTYFVAEIASQMAGCGGWSFRSTLYGGDASAVAREPVALDPGRDPARVRAMYTSPHFIRRGIGRAILKASEDGARTAGFATAELMATLAGVPLYEACGYRYLDSTTTAPIDGVSIRLERMVKAL